MPQPAALETLHPTQMTLGLREVLRRQAKFTALDAGQRAAYIAERMVPCVRGPGRVLYLIDRHHMCRALLGAGLKEVPVEVICDVSALGSDEFWRFMDLRGWLHPFDREGRRRPVSDVPSTLADLADDPFRALASFVRREDGFEKADTPFEEFIWADFLRHRVPLADVQANFETASVRALELARSPQAKHLPGWRGKA